MIDSIFGIRSIDLEVCEFVLSTACPKYPKVFLYTFSSSFNSIHFVLYFITLFKQLNYLMFLRIMLFFLFTLCLWVKFRCFKKLKKQLNVIGEDVASDEVPRFLFKSVNECFEEQSQGRPETLT